MAVLSENVLTVNMLLSVFVLPSALTHFCSKKGAAISITTSKKIEALSGSCLEIPCSFTVKDTFDSNKTINAVWMKNNLDFTGNPNVVIFNGSNPDSNYVLKITGDLRERNCTTLFSDVNANHTDIYFFRIENGQFKATACDDTFKVTVKDSPWSPSINISVDDLKEHQSVTITCSALTPCPNSPPELTWNLQLDSHRQNEKNTDGTFTTKIQENITLSDTHDGYNIKCSARYPVIGGSKTAETEVTLSVSYAPKDTSASISPSGLVSAGSWVELNCSSRAKPPPSFTWFWNSPGGARELAIGNFYSFRVIEGEEYNCMASNDLGYQTSPRIHLNVEAKGCSFWVILIGILVGLILFICLVIFVWYFKSKLPQQTQSQIPANGTEVESPYESMGLINWTPEASSASVWDSGQQENRTVDSPGDIYAQPKKK